MYVAVWLKRAVLLIALVVVGFVGWGFYARLTINHIWYVQNAEDAVIDPRRAEDPFVGLALSGGGGRAAVFGAAGMQVLAEHGYLQAVSHVSSVSGGGFPAAYLAAHPMDLPGCAVVGTLVQEPTCAEIRRYFDDLQTVLSRDFVTEILWRQLSHPNRLFSPSRRLVSLQEVLETARANPDRSSAQAQLAFLGPTSGAAGTCACTGKPSTNGDVGAPACARQAERCAKTFGDITDGRRYYFNAVSYDFGRRFVLSNAVVQQPGDLDGHRMPEPLRSLSFSRACALFPNLADCTAHSVDPAMPLSLAVAISAAFPFVMGPASIQVEGGGEAPAFWHLGDGGVLENTGVETLREAYFTQTLEDPSAPDAVIFSFDAGKRLEGATVERARDISLWSRPSDLPRMTDSILTYANAYRDAYEAEAARNAPSGIDVVSFRYLDVEQVFSNTPLKPRQTDALTQIWRADCAKSNLDLASTFERIIGIGTSYSIGTCDAALMRWAARVLVEDWIQRQPREPSQ